MAEAPKVDRISQLEQQIAALTAQLARQSSADMGVEAVRLLAERSAPINNPNYNEVSPFTYPEGEKGRAKPKLSRDTFFCGARQRDEELTPQEIDLFNAFTSSRSLPKPYGSWTARLTRNGTAEELHVDVPAGSVDARMSLPSLAAILGELLTGDVQLSQQDLVAQLRAEVEELKRSVAAA